MLQIFLSHNIRIREANTPLRGVITKELTIDNPAFKKAQRIGKRAWGIQAKLELYLYDQGDLVVPRGFLKRLEEILKAAGLDPSKVIVKQQQAGSDTSFGWAEGWDLREYQQPFVDAVSKENGVGVAPAGSGKTIMGLRFVSEKGKAAVWLTHTTDLMYQTAEKARKLLPGVGEIGFFGDGKHSWGDGRLIIATVQTLGSNPHLIDAMNEFVGTVVIDEAHHFPAVQFVNTAGRFKAENMLGVTATPDRKDGLEAYLYAGVGPLLHTVGRDALYDTGELIKPTVKFVYTDFNYETASDRNEIDSVEAGGDDMDYTDVIRHLINDEARIKLIAQNILDNLGKKQIVITESVRYCYMLQDALKEAYKATGIRKMLITAVVHGGITRTKWQTTRPIDGRILEEKKVPVKNSNRTATKYKVEDYTAEEFKAWQVTPGQRKALMERANAGEIDILFATQLAREGLDMPHLSVGHMAMPKRGDGSGKANGGAVEQEIGRIQRKDPADPDKVAIWYDYVDYNVGVFKQQYQSRRSVYKRLGIALPKKPRTEKDDIESFLGGKAIFDLPW